jgi:uncharacterized spore protein YtfJ
MNFSLKGQSKVGTCVGLFMMMLLLVSITTFSTSDTAEAGGSGSDGGGDGGSNKSPSPGASQSSDKSPSPGASKSSDKSPSQSSGNTTTQAGQTGLSNGSTFENKATGKSHSVHGTAAEASVAGKALAAVTGGTVKVFEVQSTVTGLTVGHIAVTTPRTVNTSNNNNDRNNDNDNDNNNNRNNNRNNNANSNTAAPIATDANSNTAAPIATDANSNTAAPTPTPTPAPKMTLTAQDVIRVGTTTVSWDTGASYSMDCTVTGAGIEEPIIFNPSTDGPEGDVITEVLTSTGLYELRCTEPNSGLVFIETFSIEVVGSIQEI